MTVNSHARIVLSLGREKDFTPNLGSLLELGPIVVEAGQSAKDGKELGISCCPSNTSSAWPYASSTSRV
jgi:hypothetical protein